MKFNNYQLAILNKAAGADERTANLLKKFNRAKTDFDKNILYLSLLDAYDYWAVALALGKEEADRIRGEYNALAHIEAQELIKEIKNNE